MLAAYGPFQPENQSTYVNIQTCFNIKQLAIDQSKDMPKSGYEIY